MGVGWGPALSSGSMSPELDLTMGPKWSYLDIVWAHPFLV